jgi:hypothetical protein
VLGHDLWLKAAFAVARHFDAHRTFVGQNGLPARAVAMVALARED